MKKVRGREGPLVPFGSISLVVSFQKGALLALLTSNPTDPIDPSDPTDPTDPTDLMISVISYKNLVQS